MLLEGLNNVHSAAALIRMPSHLHIFPPLRFCFARCLVCCHGDSGSEGLRGAKTCSYGDGSSAWLQKELPHLLSMQKKVSSGLVLTRGSWTWDVEEATYYRLSGIMQFCNVTKRNEVFVNEVAAKAVLLSCETVDNLITSVHIYSRHPGENAASRKDGYWPAYILQAGQSTQIKVMIDIRSQHGQSLTNVQALRLDLDFVSYGPHGRLPERQHVVLPLQFPDVPQKATWQRAINNGAVLPVKTHILCHMDDPKEILKVYAMHYAKAGDTIVIGETPLAIMQGRFRHPYGIVPSLLAKLSCRCFHPTSSLATACGMQALLDITGKLRVIAAIIFAVLARLIGLRGVFYRLAGEQARLVDDVTGTLPPYDQFITLGPVQAQDTVDFLQAHIGVGVAIVDANNIGGVHILAASNKVDSSYLKKALATNPAGNADEQTPLVIVRPPSTS